ncbi:MAG: hypothetical protein WCK42_05875 [Myxococcaceae bacterium]
MSDSPRSPVSPIVTESIKLTPAEEYLEIVSSSAKKSQEKLNAYETAYPALSFIAKKAPSLDHTTLFNTAESNKKTLKTAQNLLLPTS